METGLQSRIRQFRPCLAAIANPFQGSPITQTGF